MEWCLDEAARLGCDELHFDSGQAVAARHQAAARGRSMIPART
jgi:hypothetical protein